MPAPQRFIDYRTAVLIVIANMIGTGVFTTLGLQAEVVPDGAALLLLWGLGGLVALCGALSYAELAAALPRSGGEYHFLSCIYNPALGTLAGWVSVTVGFSAPVALAAMALGSYAGTFLPVDPRTIAVVTVVVVTALHAFDLALGRGFQVFATLLKVAVIVFFCLVGLMHGTVADSLTLTPSTHTLGALFSAPFALSLIYVSYAYSGWNAAAYVVDEVQSPQRTVPRALVHGTLAVTGLYLLLNLTFLRTTGLGELAGTVEVGALSARNIFGEKGGMVFSLVLSLLLISTISAMVLAGPRVLQAIGEDVPVLRFLSARNRRGAPTRAVLVQLGLALGFILTDSFEGVLTFTGFTLTLFALITVAGVLRLRRREPDLMRPFRVPLYPLPPLVFLIVSGMSLLVVTWERPVAVLGAAGLLAVGGLLLRGHTTRRSR
ncbi:MAG: APC family permease [Pseudomonadota bacterium]|nr:APC family permease [Pseudomonadota bacterium]